jgi:hypothetical protein
VMPVTTSAFNLPEHLVAKADPTLIAGDEQHFAAVGDPRALESHRLTANLRFLRINLASLSINYRTPEEVMAEAEPVIRAVFPDASVPTSVRRSPHRPRTDLRPRFDPRHLARRARRWHRMRHRRPHVQGNVPRTVADPGNLEGPRVRPRRPC